MFSAKIDNAGSVFLEVMLVVVILSIGLTSIARVLLSNSSAFRENANYLKAAFLLEQELNNLEQMALTGRDNKEKGRVIREQGGRYRIGTEAVAAQPRRDFLQETKLTVSWGTGAKQREVSVNTYVFEATGH